MIWHDPDRFFFGDSDVPDTDVVKSVTNQNRLTNADRIRAMSDEELAEWIATAVDRLYPVPSTDSFFWLEWLKQEVDDG